MDKVRVKLLMNHSDYNECISIQRIVWHHEDIDLTPAHQFCISVETGAILLGAFIGKKMAGFVYSFPAFFEKKLCQHSHLLAVLPDYQGYGIGKKLKWTQREIALKRGYDLITWTFDPLQAKNANLNLHTLGAITRTYLPNFYGLLPSLTLGPSIPTDRLFIEWWIRQKRVEHRWKKKFEIYDAERMPKALEQKLGPKNSGLILKRPRFFLGEKLILVAAPKSIQELSRKPDILAGWQKSMREIMGYYFSRGYRVEDFIFDKRSFYVLKKGGE